MVVTRFAPAPTGLLHIGHVLNAVYVWGLARASGGRVLLRVEDHDRQRSRPEFERALLEDLDWLGFIPDEPSTDAFRGVCGGRQSDRQSVYEAALDRLRAAGRVYSCACSRQDIAVAADPSADSRYPGTCADKRLVDRKGLGLRVRLDPSTERFEDLRHGAQSQCPMVQCGDVLLRDRQGNWTYQFAVTVDDLAQGVTLVVRGDDLLPSTGRQIQLARLLGRDQPPRFFHHPLVMKESGQKLSKADRDTSVRGLRAGGMSAEEVIGQAAAFGGLTGGAQPIAARDVSGLVGPMLAKWGRSEPV